MPRGPTQRDLTPDASYQAWPRTGDPLAHGRRPALIRSRLQNLGPVGGTDFLSFFPRAAVRGPGTVGPLVRIELVIE